MCPSTGPLPLDVDLVVYRKEDSVIHPMDSRDVVPNMFQGCGGHARVGWGEEGLGGMGWSRGMGCDMMLHTLVEWVKLFSELFCNSVLNDSNSKNNYL